MSGLEPIIFGLTLTQLVPLATGFAVIGGILVGVLRFLMRHVTKEAVAVRKEMTEKLKMHEKNLNQSSDRIVDRQKEIQSMIEILNARISEIKNDVTNTVDGVKQEIHSIEESVTKRLDHKQAEIQRIQNSIDILRVELQKLEIEQARREGLRDDRMTRQDERILKGQTGTTEHRYDTGHSKVSEDLHGEGVSRDATTKRDPKKGETDSSLSDEKVTED